jgi:hypothetical protein
VPQSDENFSEWIVNEESSEGQTRSIKAEHADEGLALTLVAPASCPRRWGRDAPTTAAETAALRGVTKAGLSLGFQ